MRHGFRIRPLRCPFGGQKDHTSALSCSFVQWLSPCLAENSLTHRKNMRVIPTLKHYCGIVSDITSGSMYGIFMLTFYLTFFAAYALKFYLTFNLASILTNFLTFFLAFYLASIPTFCHLFRHSFWRSFWHINLVYLLAFYLVHLRRFFVAQALRSSLILSLRWRYDGEHFDPEVAVGVRRGTLRSRACS